MGTIRQRYGEDQVLIEPARLKLAHAVLAVATEDTINAEELRERVLDIVGR